MAEKKLTQKEIWAKAAKKAASKFFVLAILIPVARKLQTTYGRVGAFLEAHKQRIRVLMRRQGLDQTHGALSLATLIPNVTMGSDLKGAKQYQRLVRKYGADWTTKSVKVTKRCYPAYHVILQEKVGRRFFKTGQELVPAKVETVYEFTRTGTTAEMLEYTRALGNTVAVKLGPLTKTYKEGLERNAHKKKVPA